MDALRPPLLKRLRPGHWVAIDCAVTAAMALVYAAEFSDPPYLPGMPEWATAATVLAVLPAALRRRSPRAVLALVVTGGAVLTALSTSVGLPLAVAFVMYLIPLRFPPREALRLLAGTLVVTAAGLAVFGIVPHGIFRNGGVAKAGGLLLAGGLLIIVAWMIGYSVRQQRAYLADRQEQAERRAREQMAEARRASTEERLQIARELHDVVAHTMSLIAVQAGVANYVVAAQPEEAARALSSIEQISRGALREMRALLGVLRAEGAASGPGPASDGNGGGSRPAQQGTALVPAPGLADLDGLVARTAEAGVRVDLDVRGERPPLPAGLDLAAYRVIQEAITNVIKHAATDSCRVAVAYQEDALTLEITDSGHGVGAGNGCPAAGHGLAGMRERVGMYGGEFRAAPRPGRGFRVTAWFPLDPAAA
jgi:signal transduction histidine kinase